MENSSKQDVKKIKVKQLDILNYSNKIYKAKISSS